MDSKDANKSIEELQILEQQLHGLLAQKQMIQVETQEISNALEELDKTKEDVYKVLSGVMLKADKEDLNKELEEKKKLSELRITSIEKQEKIFENRINDLREKIMGKNKG